MFYLLVSCLLFGSSYAKIPEAGCSLSDSKLDTCLRNFANNLILQMSSEGIPEVNLQPLDPLIIPELVIHPKNSRIAGKLKLRDLKVTGLAKTEVLSVVSDLNKHVDQTLEMNITNPKLVVTGKYKGRVTVDFIKVFGDGEFELQLTKVGVTAKVLGDDLKRDGEVYFAVTSVDVNPVLGGLKVSATHLFNDNIIFASYALNLVNNHWREYYDQVLPQVKPFLENFIADKINEFTTKVPANEILKP